MRQLKLNVAALVVATAVSGALVGCDGGAYDAATGRFVPAEDRAAATAPAEVGAAPAAMADQAALAGTGVAPAVHGGAEAARPAAVVAPGSAPAFSRAMPAPVLDADGTPSKPVIARVAPEAGGADGGEEILIAGSGFANVQVLFGSAPARITSQSSNAITVIAPEGTAGRPVSLVVTNRDGTYAVASAAYTYR